MKKVISEPSPREISQGGGLSSGQTRDLLETSIKTKRNEVRVELLRDLQNRSLSTNDIFEFAKNQAGLRKSIKSLDSSTMRRAMKIKLKDLKLTLDISRREEKQIKTETLNRLGNNHQYKSLVKKIKQAVQEEEKGLREKYSRKIKHYQRKQGVGKKSKGPDIVKDPTITPYNLRDFSEINIFRRPEDLPKPERPLGPFICDSSIKLSKQEISILSRDPKFCVMEEVDEMSFMVELERGLSKHRYNRG